MNYALLFGLTYKSMKNRKLSVGLTLLSITISIFLLISVETIRSETKNSFTSTVSGTDLIVGARSGSVQLLLYSVFHIGNATNNIDWRSYQEISQHRSVKWSIPISLGDSHKGFRVIGTNQDMFRHFRYGNEQALRFREGSQFEDLYDVVIGADIAAKLNYQLGAPLVLSHGLQDTGFARHDDKPFRLKGILQKTGTPIDQSIFISLKGIEALHVDWKGGTRSRQKVSAEQARGMSLETKQITAFMLGLNSKMAVFKLQRAINDYNKEPLLAILPGIALGELWQLLSVAEQALLVVTIFVLISSLIGLLSAVLGSLTERRREIAILRSLGARRSQIFILLQLESFIFTALGCALGLALYYGALNLAQPMLQQEFGLTIATTGLSSVAQTILLGVLCLGFILGALPGYLAYRYSLADGMSVKL